MREEKRLTVEKICETGSFEAESERVRELRMTKVVNQQAKML